MLVELAALVTGVVAYSVSHAAVPPITRVAVTRKLLDFPDGARHHHTQPVPRLGGVAVFAGLLAAGCVMAVAAATLSQRGVSLPPLAGALLTAGVILFGVGLLDDLHGVRPALKLATQAVAALVVYRAGFRLDVLSVPPGHEFSLGVLSLPVTVLWLVGISNAFNLIDGIDGLAGGVAVLALIATAATAMILGNVSVLVYALALVGALLGFLRFNFPPARIFLGDSGSLVVGFLLAVLTVKGATRHGEALYALMPIFALSYLLLDTGIAILRRWLRGVPFSRADGRHIHHQLRAVGLSARRAVLMIYGQVAVAAMLGLCATFVPPAVTVALAAAGGAMLLVMMMYGVRRLEYTEFIEAQASVISAARKARTVIQDRINARDVARVIGSAQTIQELEAILENSAPTFRFAHIQLSDGSATALPMRISQEIHASRLWKLEYPITAHVYTEPEVQKQADRAPTVLNICCAIGASRRPAGAERVAQILAPAIAERLATVNSAEVAVAVPRHSDLLVDMVPDHEAAFAGPRVLTSTGQQRLQGPFDPAFALTPP